MITSPVCGSIAWNSQAALWPAMSTPALTRRTNPFVRTKSKSPWNTERPPGTEMLMSPTFMSPSRKLRESRSGSRSTTTCTWPTVVVAVGSFWNWTVNGSASPAGTYPPVSAANGPVTVASPVAWPGPERNRPRSGPASGVSFCGFTPVMR